jgi:uncharacterized lipoprotein YbaY
MIRNSFHRPHQAAFFLAATLLATMAGEGLAQTEWNDIDLLPQDSLRTEGWDRRSWPSDSGTRNNWQLGVTGENTDAGVVIREVLPNSSAARARLSPGDVIICVDGHQVGRVGSQIFDLREELAHHADARGRVSMLVHFQQSGRVRPGRVQLQDEAAGLSGTLVLADRRMPPNAVVTVRLENITRPHYVVRNGEYSFRLSGYSSREIPFRLDFDPAYISARDVYQVRAFVTSRGQTLYETVRPPRVLTQGNPSSVRMTLRPVAAPYEQYGDNDLITVAYNRPDTHQDTIYSEYQQSLGREPRPTEMAAWYNTCGVDNDRIRQLPLQLMASDEYYNRSGGNNVDWLRSVFRRIVGHAPTNTEVNLWMRRFDDLRNSRMELLRQLEMQSRG